jgi:hypothetical protein
VKAFAIRDDSGLVYAFEVRQVFISVGALMQTLSQVEMVSNVCRPPRASRREGARIEFQCGGKQYVVWEPFGDSSRYWIGPLDEDSRCEPHQLEAVEDALRAYRTPIVRRVLGNLLSLNFGRLLQQE